MPGSAAEGSTWWAAVEEAPCSLFLSPRVLGGEGWSLPHHMGERVMSAAQWASTSETNTACSVKPVATLAFPEMILHPTLTLDVQLQVI